MSDRRRFSQQTSRILNSDHHTLKTNIDNKSAEGADLQWNESKFPPPEKILKIAFAICLFIIVLGSGFIARITFHILMWHISPPIMSNDSNINRLGGLLESNCSACNGSDCWQSDSYSAVDEIWIWAVFLVIVAPYFLTFLSTFFRICFKTNKRLEWKVLLAAMSIETIHSIGVSILAFLVLPSFDPASASVIYMAVALVPAIINVVDIVVDKRLHQNTKVSKYSPFDDAPMLSLPFPVLGIVFQIIGIILIGLYIDRGWLSGIFVVAALFTSVKYWENFITMGDEDSVLLRRLKRELHVGRTKVTCLANIWKITITFLAAITIFTSKSDDPMAVFKSFFNNGNATIFSIFGEQTLGDNPICQYNVPLLTAVITIICDYLCYKATKTVCAIYCQRFGFGIPMVILPVATTFTLVGLMHSPDILKFESCDVLFSDWCVKGNGNLIENCTVLFVAFFLLYFSILLITRHVWKVNGYKHGETARIFVQPFYCGMLIDISLLLNRRRYDKEYDIVHKRKRKMLYACCATMWHETANEMTQLLKSIFRLDMKQFTTEMIAESAKDDDQVEPFDFEGNVFFDDAFDPPKEGQPGPDVNDYVKTFIQVINEAGSAVHGKRITIPDGQMYRTPYGARIYWDLPGGNKLVVHLKDKNKIRRKKRWSQVMYMFYILKWTLVNQYGKAGLQEAAENTYLLALDGDVDFEPEAVLSLMKRMNKSPLVGAVCGRIHPIGSGPMVWYQKFEYAISHWLQKAAEHVLGCVLCSPGCFSLFRGSAILHPDVLDTYTTDSTEAEHFIQYDQGEDRWLCTLLLKQGWKIEYCAESDAYTYAPEGFYEFYNQRRRWVPSTMINVLDVIMDWKQITNNNENISFLYIVYHSILFASVLLTPGTIFMLVFGAIILGFESIPPWLSLVLNLIPVGIFLIMTLYASQQRQIQYAAVLSVVYVIVMVIVLIGVLRTTIVEGFCSTATFFTIAVGGIFIISAIIHPKEILCIIPGLLYFLAIPSMSMLMFLYSIGNLHVVSWGTREATPDTKVKKSTQKHKPENEEKGYFCSLGDFFGCIFCPSNTYTKEDFLYTNMMNKVDRIVKGEKGDEENDGTINADGKGHAKNTDEKSGPVENVDRSGIQDKNSWDDRIFKTENDEEYNLIADRHVKAIPKNEIKFWKKTIRKHLKPLNMSPTKEKKIQDDLVDLRNRVSLFVYLLNGVLVTVMYSLTQVNVFENDLTITFVCGGRDDNKIVPIAILFAVVFGILLSIQFICMLYHRFSTLIHVAANTDIWESEKTETTKIDEKIASRLVSAETHRSRKTTVISDKDRTVLDMNRSIVKEKGTKFRQLSEIVQENMQKMKIDVDKMRSLEKLEGSVFQKRNSKIAERYAMKWKHRGKTFGSIVDQLIIKERNKKEAKDNNFPDEDKTATQTTPSVLRKNQVYPSDKEMIKRRQSVSSNNDYPIDHQIIRVEDDSDV